MIQFNDVSKRYPGGHVAIQDVSFTLARGEMAFLTGHSGAGKSTLFKLIALIERPSTGELIVDNKNLGRLGRRQIPYLRREIGMIFQDFRLLQDRTVYANVALPLVISGIYEENEIGRRVRAALDKVGLLDKEKYYPMELSGGEQQRVGIARAVVHKPPMLLADEPTGNLDSRTSIEIMGIFQDLNDQGRTIVLITHEPDIAQHAKRIVHVRDGRIQQDEVIQQHRIERQGIATPVAS